MKDNYNFNMIGQLNAQETAFIHRRTGQRYRQGNASAGGSAAGRFVDAPLPYNSFMIRSQRGS